MNIRHFMCIKYTHVLIKHRITKDWWRSTKMQFLDLTCSDSDVTPGYDIVFRAVVSLHVNVG